MENLAKYFAVAFGGAIDAVARYALNHSFLANLFAGFPFPTFFINTTVSFAIGFLFTVTTEKMEMSESLRLFLTVGFLGAYKTFSTFEFETLQLVRERNSLLAVAYVILSVAVGFIRVVAGILLARRI